jgi:cytochrome P450
MMAGTLTTAWVLEVSTFHLLRQPEILRRLKAEIKTAVDNWSLETDVIGKVNEQGKLAHLETLPYLNAVIKESLRLTYGVAGRLARIATEENLRFTDNKSGKTWVIPAGIPVGMSVAQIHHDESVFPDSRTFNPARWYDEVEIGGKKAMQLHTRLDRYLLSFTRGSRQCLGMPLSYAEMFLCMEGVWNRYGSAPGIKPASEGGSEEERRYEGVRFESDVGVLSLTETSMRDVVLAADSFLPLVAEGSKGIKVFVLP